MLEPHTDQPQNSFPATTDKALSFLHKIRGNQNTVLAQHAGYFSQRALGFRQKVQGIHNNHGIEARVRIGQG